MNRTNALERNVYPGVEQAAVWQDSFALSDSDQCCRWLLEISSDPILLRASPEQLKQLKLADTGMQMVTVAPDGTLLDRLDILLIPEW